MTKLFDLLASGARKHPILSISALVGLALVIGLSFYGILYERNPATNPAQVAITQALINQSSSGQISATVYVRNIGTRTVSLSGNLNSFFVPSLNFSPSSPSPGEISTGTTSTIWSVAQFDGSSSSIDIPNSPTLNPATFTLEFALRYNSTNPDQQMMVGKGSAGGDSFYFYTFRSANNVNDFVIYDNNIRYDQGLGDVLVSGRWYDIAFVVDGQNVYGYVDGVLANEWSHSVSFRGNPNDIIIGKCGCDGYFFNGSIAFVRMYDRPLASSEVMTNHETSQPSTAGLVLWLSLNQTNGSIVRDMSGLGNDGIFSGAVVFAPLSLPCEMYRLTIIAIDYNGKGYSISKDVKPNC